MTSDLRQQLRTIIDERARAHRQERIDLGDLQVCAGCGCDLNNRSAWCDTCSDRWRRRERRNQPGFLEAERRRQQESRARRRKKAVTA